MGNTPFALHEKQQKSIFSLFSSFFSLFYFLFCGGIAHSRLHACNWLCSFRCRRCCVCWPLGRTDSGRLAPRVNGYPPLTCFHVLSCGSISSAYIMRTDQCYPRQLCTDAVRGSCEFWAALPADAGVPTSPRFSLTSERLQLAHAVQLRTFHMRGFGAAPRQRCCSQTAAGPTRNPVNPVQALAGSTALTAHSNVGAPGRPYSCIACHLART